MSASFNQVVDFRRRHFLHLPAAPAQSPVSKGDKVVYHVILSDTSSISLMRDSFLGPLPSHTAKTLPRHHHRRHRIRDRAVSPSASTAPGNFLEKWGFYMHFLLHTPTIRECRDKEQFCTHVL